MIYIVCLSAKANAAFLSFPEAGKKTAPVKVLRAFPADFSFQTGDRVYLDISGLLPGEIKKAAARLKKDPALSFWGIIDPKGTAEDPAAFFFEGARDYIGLALIKKGLTKKRFDAALLGEKRAGKPAPAGKSAAAGRSAPADKPVFPERVFPGWKSMRAGTNAPFLFLFVSVSGNYRLYSMAREEFFATVKNRLREELRQCLRESGALLWMETEENFLFLVPPSAAAGASAVEAALKIILSGRLINIEKLGFAAPVEFTFALHYGETVFRLPGETGGIISESLNYIFHLGTRKAEMGRVSLSGTVPEEAVPPGLRDLFKSAGAFEGISVRHSRRFVYKT